MTASVTLTNDEGTLYYTKRGAASSEKDNPGTGAEGVSAFIAPALGAGAALVLSKKRA